MRLYQTREGVFVKKLGKVYLFVGDGFAEVPILTAKQIHKLRNKIEQQVQEEVDES